MIKFREDIELIKCDLWDYENPPKEVTNIRSLCGGVIGPWPVGDAMVDNSDFPGPVYRDKNGEGIKHKVVVQSGDYLVKADGHIFYVPLTIFAALLKTD